MRIFFERETITAPGIMEVMIPKLWRKLIHACHSFFPSPSVALNRPLSSTCMHSICSARPPPILFQFPYICSQSSRIYLHDGYTDASHGKSNLPEKLAHASPQDPGGFCVSIAYRTNFLFKLGKIHCIGAVLERLCSDCVCVKQIV